MATDLENLKTAKSALLASYAAHAGIPDNQGDGRQVSWGSLLTQLRDINAEIAAIEGPWAIKSLGT